MREIGCSIFAGSWEEKSNILNTDILVCKSTTIRSLLSSNITVYREIAEIVLGTIDRTGKRIFHGIISDTSLYREYEIPISAVCKGSFYATIVIIGKIDSFFSYIIGDFFRYGSHIFPDHTECLESFVDLYEIRIYDEYGEHNDGQYGHWNNELYECKGRSFCKVFHGG